MGLYSERVDGEVPQVGSRLPHFSRNVELLACKHAHATFLVPDTDC